MYMYMYLVDVPPVSAMVIESLPQHSHHQTIGLTAECNYMATG